MIKYNKHKNKSKIIDFFTTTNDYSLPSDDESTIANKSSQRNVFLLKLRTKFASSAEKSKVSLFFEQLYYNFLSYPLSVIGVFLGVFGVCSLALSLAVSNDKLGYISDSSNWITFFLIVVSLLLLPVKKDIAFILTQSRLLSNFQFSYDTKVLNTAKRNMVFYSGYSSAFFLGLLTAILSVIFSPTKVIVFVCLIVCSLIIVNRPESGVLLSAFFIPFINTEFLNLLLVFTAFSLVYKYLRVKRHITFGNDELFLCLIGFLFFLWGTVNVSGVAGTKTMIAMIFSVITYICVKNLIKSVSLFNNFVKLMAASAMIISLITLIIYLFTAIMGEGFINRFSVTEISGKLLMFFKTNGFIPVFITATVPLNLALGLGLESASKRTKYSFLVIVQFLCVMIYGNINLIMCVVFSVIVVLAFFKLKTILILPFSPVISLLLHKICEFIPLGNSFLSADSSGGASKMFSELISQHALFGIGLGKDNFIFAISPYVNLSSENITHCSTTFQNALVCFGIPAASLIAGVIIYLNIKNLKTAIVAASKYHACKSACCGLLGSCVCMILMSIFIYIPSLSAGILFAQLCSLCACANECIKSDYIDNNRVRFQ